LSTTAPAQTVLSILEKTTTFFSGKGITTARLDAELLLAHVLGMDRLRLYLNFDRPMSEGELTRARELVRRRGTREPIAYILGEREFGSRAFEVNSSVLIPRPTTELLVEQAEAELLRRFADAGSAFRILEFGVGSGVVSITLASAFPNAQLLATEISAEAAATARRNAERHGVSDRVDIRVQEDFAQIEGPFHAIVSNPPYVDPATLPGMQPDVRDYEPHHALFAEEQGLHWYRFLTGEAGELLNENGFLLVEMGEGQAPAVARLAEVAGLRMEAVTRDYGGVERIMRIGK
jgi:release factor glutamine methyltransferase